MVVVTLDTTRADRFGCYGHPSVATPALDSLAREGVLFEHAEAGYISMPARGAASHATNYDVEVAAEYMLHITYPDRPTD